MSSKLQTANEETPLLSAPTIVDQASSSASSDNAKLLSAKKKRHRLGMSFALYAPMIQFYTVIFCYKYYQQQSGDSGADIPLDNCAIPEVQAIVSEAQAIIIYYGALSDRKGRRLIMMISTLGSLIQIALFIITIKYIHIFGISLLFIAPIIKGLMAGDTVAIAAVQAYISDCTTRAERTIAFGNMMATVFLGTSIGPTVASFLLNKTKSINSIFYMVFIIHFVIGLYFWLVMPESNDISQYNSESKQQGKQSFLQRINIFSALQILHRRSTSEHASQYALPLMAGVQFLLYIVMMPPSLLYAMLQFNGQLTKVVFSLVCVLLLASNKATTTSTPSSSPPTSPATSAIKVEEEEPASPSSSTSSAIVDTRRLTIETVCFVAFGLVTTSVGFSITGATQSFALLAAPSLRSLLTSLVDPTEIGELLGAMAVLEACGMIISQLTINTIYSASVATMPNLIFFVCAIISGLALTFSFFVHPSKPLNTTNDTS
ncbi:major facilitator superfamily domain-containing protein [Mucor lusitanicus]